MQTTLEEDTAFGRSADASKIAQGDAQHQGAGTRSHEEDEGTIYPIAEEDVGLRHNPLHQSWHHHKQGSECHHHGSVDACNFCEHLFDWSFARCGIFHHLEDAREGIFAQSAVGAEIDGSIHHNVARHHALTYSHFARHALSGESCGVELCRSIRISLRDNSRNFAQHPIQRHACAALYTK